MNNFNLLLAFLVIFLGACGQKAATTTSATTTTTTPSTTTTESSTNATSDVLQITKTHAVQVLGAGQKGYQKVEIQLANGFKMLSDVGMESEESGKKAYSFEAFKLQRDGKEIFAFAKDKISKGEVGYVDINETSPFFPAVVKRNNTYAIFLVRFLGEGIEKPYVLDAIWITDSFTGYSDGLNSYKTMDKDFTDAEYQALFEQVAQANQ